MGLLDNLGNLARELASGNASEADVHSAYDQVAHTVPQGTLADGISHVFQSEETPPFPQMVGGLYERSNPDQKAGLLNQILGALGPGGAAQLLSGIGGLAGLGRILTGGSVTPAQAEQIPPETVEVLAQHAAKKDPTIMDKAAGFYAQHPTLIKAIGAGALALLMSRMSARRR
ncbi:MAG: hypothetical protein ABI968_06380 [Acidobacteriota bacterium]